MNSPFSPNVHPFFFDYFFSVIDAFRFSDLVFGSALGVFLFPSSRGSPGSVLPPPVPFLLPFSCTFPAPEVSYEAPRFVAFF